MPRPSTTFRILRRRWQLERDQLTRIVAAADGEDDVLLTIEHISHRRAALGGGYVNRADFFAGGLVVGAQHRTAYARWRREEAGLTGDYQALGGQNTDQARTAGARNVQTFESRMILDVVRRFAVRDLPGDVALVQIDGRNAPIRRLQQGQALHGKSAKATTAASATSR